MRKIVLFVSVSLDGYFEGPDREIDWHLVDDELHRHFNEQLKVMGGFLEGRVTHELMAGYWPTADADPSVSAPTAEFAAIWRDMPKIVFSRTLQQAAWNTTIRREVTAEQIRVLKAEPGGDLVLGGADLAAEFVRLGLVDEYRIYVHPVVIGQGRRFIHDPGHRIGLRLIDTKAFGNGVVLLHYRTADGSAAG
ncbi:deaminase [Kitasatospora herbaricolor]|uniref:dihydrofolate reductase family protein n=1 Tax=Kitasatospora herbaricolor TaxID=68217 RepID=UPI00174D3E6B|nr:dihydrofolate reductase family protein [Kitasatospora herbaricolor]MDQ0311795.1 dihydrofolate reductase [Kitasatospora herbaricolor]GGU96471.1 deaminase [Kitasatospora herbaricolor]